MRLLIAFIFVSALLHLFAVIFLPALGVMTVKSEDIVPIYVEIVPKEPERPKSEPVKTIREQSAPVQNAVASIKETPKVEELPTEKVESVGTEMPLVLPDISVPKSSVESAKEIALPNVINEAKIKNPETPKGKNVDTELAALEAAYNKKSTESSVISRGSDNMSKASSIYNFDILPTNNRRITSIPPEPKFSLENDAKITLKFTIDKFGNTGDIEYVTRNNSVVEKLAYDYIRYMKFTASINDDKDSAQITISFKVIK